MEFGETVDEALCREVREETGLEVKVRSACWSLFKASKARGGLDIHLSSHWWHAAIH